MSEYLDPRVIRTGVRVDLDFPEDFIILKRVEWSIYTHADNSVWCSLETGTCCRNAVGPF